MARFSYAYTADRFERYDPYNINSFPHLPAQVEFN